MWSVFFVVFLEITLNVNITLSLTWSVLSLYKAKDLLKYLGIGLTTKSYSLANTHTKKMISC